MTGSPRRLRADWVVPVSAPPISDGAVLVGGDGRIIMAGPDASVPTPSGTIAETFRGTVLIPGLVNTHTHLELTGLEGTIPPDDFVAWIARLRELKAARSAAEVFDAACQGVRNCWAAGVTTVGDTGDSGAVIRALAHLGGAGVCYQEVFGPDPDQVPESLAFLARRLDELAPLAGPRIRLGISPHAPYSVSAALYHAVAALAGERGMPLAVHLAESPAETSLLTSGTGAFAEMWASRGIAPPPSARSPVAYLDRTGVLGPETLAIHVVQADHTDLATLAARQVAVAHCPLSNRSHRHGEAPLAAMLARGIAVGVGTDSVVSVGRLDLLAEARAARILGALDAETALALCTVGAAQALGLGQEVGTLAPGCWGDLAAIRLRDRAPSDLHEAVLASGPGDVRATWVGGREVYRANRDPLSLLGDSLPAGA